MPGWATPEAFTAFTGLSGFGSLTDGSATGLSNTIDNATDKYEFISLKLNLATFFPAGSSAVHIYIVYALDGTSFDTFGNPTSDWLCTFVLSTAAAAKVVSRVNIPIGPFKFQVFLVNNSGGQFGASGNALSYSRYNEA
jgi:hypothetical protein